MNWKAEATDKLRRYDAMRVATLNIPAEIKRLEHEYTAIRSAKADGTPIHGGTSVREDAIINNIVERQELEAAIKNAKAWVEIVDRAMKSLRKEERLILHRMYIYPEKGAVERLSKDLGVEYSSIYRRRDKALKTFTIALYGITNEDLP